MRRPTTVALATALLVFHTACEPTTEPEPVTSLTLAPATPLLVPGQVLRLGVTALSSGGTDLSGRQAQWSSNNAASATVDSVGTVTAIAAGSATITAAIDSVTATVTVTVASPTQWLAIETGFSHTCALTTAGATWCWGSNGFGQTGDGSTSATRASPVEVQGEPTFVSLRLGIHHSCGLTAAGGLACWGRNDFGQLADSTTTHRSQAVSSGGSRSFSMISRGSNSNHSCARRGATTLECWGYNGFGQLALGDTTRRAVPTAVTTAFEFTQLSAGFRHSCGVTTAGAAYCWGSNAFGQLGDGTDTSRAAPTLVSGAQTFAEVHAGFQHTCARTTAGAVYCWGANDRGQLGTGNTTPSLVPVQVTGGLTFTRLHASSSHGCGITAGNAAHCWGENNEGQLGDGSNIDRPAPVAVSGGHAFARISGGLRHLCGLTTTGTALCWGGNAEGQLGDGSFDRALVPQLIAYRGYVEPIYEEVWSGTAGPATVTLRLRVIGTSVQGRGTSNDPSDPPSSQLSVTGTMNATGAVSLSLQPLPQLYNGSIIDANAAAIPLTGTRTSATRITGSVAAPGGTLALVLTRQ